MISQIHQQNREGFHNMDIRINSILGASIFGIAIILIASVISTAINYNTMKNMAESPLFQEDFFANPEAFEENFDPETMTGANDVFSELYGANFEQTMALSSLASGLTCLAWLLGGIGSGILYPFFHRKEGAPPKTDSAVVGGLISGLVVGILGAAISGLIQVVVTLPLQQQMMSNWSSAFGAPGTGFPTSFMAVGSVIGIFCNGIFTGLICGVLGTIGGLLGSFFFGKPQEPKSVPA
jgi:hypothetical protein